MLTSQTGIPNEKISINATTLANIEFWKNTCSTFPPNTIDVVVVMGTAYDYYRPLPDAKLANQERFCNMLTSFKLHQWSSDGIHWIKTTYHVGALGGSKSGYPVDNIDGDNRAYLSFWGNKVQKGGCCSSSVSETGIPVGKDWGISFTMYIRTSTASTSTSDGALESTTIKLFMNKLTHSQFFNRSLAHYPNALDFGECDIMSFVFIEFTT